MRIALPIHEGRISPLFDVATRFLVVDTEVEGAASRREESVVDPNPAARARRMAELGVHLLVCGAISWPLENLLAAAGVRVIPNTCGSAEDVLEAVLGGGLGDRAFLMPGCPGRRQRHRRRRGWRGRDRWP